MDWVDDGRGYPQLRHLLFDPDHLQRVFIDRMQALDRGDPGLVVKIADRRLVQTNCFIVHKHTTSTVQGARPSGLSNLQPAQNKTA